MTSNYEEIYSRFLSKITDYSFVSTDDYDLYQFMNSWMRSALSRPYIRRLFTTLTFDDEDVTLTYELSTSVNEDSDKDFVIELAAMGMVIEWLEPKVKSVINISQMYGGKEQKFYSQANHLIEIKSMLKDCKTELRKMIRDRGYIYNSYINGD